MSMFGDYKSYKKYEPAYANWKNQRDITDAKRLQYLEQHPNQKNSEDIQRGKTLIRAIDIMDEHSQNYAENMEVATETISGIVLEIAIFGGALLGGIASKFKPITKFLNKHIGNNGFIAQYVPMAFGIMLASIASIPLNAWAAKAEVAASRKGRFEAMRKELNSPNGFAVLTDEQLNQAKNNAKYIVLDEDKKNLGTGLKKSFENVKNLAYDSQEYKLQQKIFEHELNKSKENLNNTMTDKEILEAKKDQQILTKLVEKIDIASQDYAENTELACNAVSYGLLGLSTLFNFALYKVLKLAKVKSAGKITVISSIASYIAPLCASIMFAKVQKQASKVGRFKVKQELLKNPEQLVYVSDEDIKNIDSSKIQLKTNKKKNIFAFLIEAWKNNKEYEKYQKKEGKEEKRLYKAIESLELSEEQTKRARQLQMNTFRTFNKVDENSQKYSESIEALGKTLSMPLMMTLMTAGSIIMAAITSDKSKKNADPFLKILKGTAANILCLMPMLPVEAKITKEQKKASRIADMNAINELNDYRYFK